MKKLIFLTLSIVTLIKTGGVFGLTATNDVLRVVDVVISSGKDGTIAVTTKASQVPIKESPDSRDVEIQKTAEPLDLIQPQLEHSNLAELQKPIEAEGHKEQLSVAIESQKTVEQVAFVEPSSPIEHPENFLPVELTNNTGFPDSMVYVFIKAAQESDGKDCVLGLNKDSTKMFCVPVTDQTDLSQFNYRLSELPRLNGKVILYVPPSISGRIYLSVGRSMELQIYKRTTRICDPDGFKPRDANYYTFYDKVEYSFTKAGTWINPTAVDFVSLPIHISQDGAASEVKSAGFTTPRDEVFKSIRDTLQEGIASSEWSKLFLTFNGTVLRVMAPGKAMVESMPGANPFNTRYLNAGISSFNYTDFLWNYYKTNTLGIDATELMGIIAIGDKSPDNYIFFGTVNSNNEFVFTNKTGTYSEVIAKPRTSIPFFAGAQESFDAPNNTPRAIIVRELTSAFDVGLLPAPSGIILSKKYFVSNRSRFYTTNPYLPDEAKSTGPWYDLYSHALHKAAGKSPVYTFAYDDALDQDGTLHDSNSQKPSLVKITIGNLSGVEIPQPEKDSNLYQVKFILPPTLKVLHEGHLLKDQEELKDAKMPIALEINGKPINLYVDPVIVKPSSQAAEGIVVDRKDKNATIIFPGGF